MELEDEGILGKHREMEISTLDPPHQRYGRRTMRDQTGRTSKPNARSASCDLMLLSDAAMKCKKLYVPPTRSTRGQSVASRANSNTYQRSQFQHQSSLTPTARTARSGSTQGIWRGPDRMYRGARGVRGVIRGAVGLKTLEPSRMESRRLSDPMVRERFETQSRVNALRSHRRYSNPNVATVQGPHRPPLPYPTASGRAPISYQGRGRIGVTNPIISRWVGGGGRGVEGSAGPGRGVGEFARRIGRCDETKLQSQSPRRCGNTRITPPMNLAVADFPRNVAPQRPLHPRDMQSRHTVPGNQRFISRRNLGHGHQTGYQDRREEGARSLSFPYTRNHQQPLIDPRERKERMYDLPQNNIQSGQIGGVRNETIPNATEIYRLASPASTFAVSPPNNIRGKTLTINPDSSSGRNKFDFSATSIEEKAGDSTSTGQLFWELLRRFRELYIIQREFRADSISQDVTHDMQTRQKMENIKGVLDLIGLWAHAREQLKGEILTYFENK
ncbi:hypothetical protein AAMO2058_001726100 [Amorphochlora amoebiformis]